MSDAAIVKPALPPALVSRADLSRLARDIEAIDNDLESQKARNRATGKTGYSMPVLSRALNDFADLNSIDLSDDSLRMQVNEQVKMLKEKAPVLHMTFAVEADPASLQQLVAYARKEIHPLALLSVGLQPNLVGGVYLRTPNHIHDFSVRSRLASVRGLIGEDLERLSNVIEVKEAPPQTPEELAEAAAELAQAGAEAQAAAPAPSAQPAAATTPPQPAAQAVPTAAQTPAAQPQEAPAA